MNAKSIDNSGIELAESLLYIDREGEEDVMEWLKRHGEERKKEAARG